jgi:uncharacterized protein
MSNQAVVTTTSDERTWAMIAHLSILINLFTGFLGPIAALLIYLLYKDRSRYVAYQAMQSFMMQLIGWVGFGFIIGAAWAIVGVLSALIVGLCLIPFAILLSFLPVVIAVYSVVGAVRTSQGEDFRYWAVGDWVRGIYTD